MAWTKVEKTEVGNTGSVRTGFAVAKSRSGSRTASLVVPGALVSGPRANVYSDGNGKLAFSMGETGTFTVTRAGEGKSHRISIPVKFADRIPYGTTEVDIQRDGDMWVLDLNSITAS